MQIPVTTSGRIHPYHPNMRPRLYFMPFRHCARNQAFLWFFIVTTAVAQEPALLINRGEPIRVPYACAEEDLQWAGMSCDEKEPCAIYLELTAIAANGRRILAAGDLHGNSATLGSILLESDDAGANWKEPSKRIRGDVVDQLQFYDSQHAWAGGETQYPLPRDPFVLITTNGGSSWTEHAVGEDGAAGSLQRLWFDSLTHGEVVIDAGKSAPDGRYVSYESDNGGESWMLRGASNKIPALKGAPADNTDWRIGPSKDGKAWQIETREGNQWASVASFLIDVAACRIDPANAGEPKP